MTRLGVAPQLIAAERLPNHSRANFIAAAGLCIMVLGAGAALSPALDHVSAATVLGLLLLSAGLLELLAGMARHQTRRLGALAGAVTMLAGVLLILNRNQGLLPNATIVTGWLFARSVILLLTSRVAGGPLRKFLGFAAAIDFVLAGALLAGLSIATFVVTIFGPSPQLLASYAWVLALSFFATATLLLEVASGERRSAS